MRIFVSAMACAGNLGDDLISTVLVNRLLKEYPNAEIGILEGEEKNEFSYQSFDNLSFFKIPRKRNLRSYFKNVKKIKSFIQTSDVLIVGGGGLLQDVHFKNNCHHWLKYRYYNKEIKSLLLGIGVGPILHENTNKYLKKVLKDFSYIEIRDEYSKKLIDNLSIQSVLSLDIVKGSQLLDVFKSNKNNNNPKTLGCSIRPWKDLSFKQTISLIKKIYSDLNIETIVLFTFEHSKEDDQEYQYATKLSDSLKNENINVKLITYTKDSILDFTNSFLNVNYALASRYHANILWQKLNIPTIPIAYSPKVDSLYNENGGRSYTAKELYEIDNFEDVFQNIKIENNYNLPDLKKIKSNVYSMKNKKYTKRIEIKDFISSSMNSIISRLSN